MTTNEAIIERIESWLNAADYNLSQSLSERRTGYYEGCIDTMLDILKLIKN